MAVIFKPAGPVIKIPDSMLAGNDYSWNKPWGFSPFAADAVLCSPELAYIILTEIGGLRAVAVNPTTGKVLGYTDANLHDFDPGGYVPNYGECQRLDDKTGCYISNYIADKTTPGTTGEWQTGSGSYALFGDADIWYWGGNSLSTQLELRRGVVEWLNGSTPLTGNDMDHPYGAATASRSSGPAVSLNAVSRTAPETRAWNPGPIRAMYAPLYNEHAGALPSAWNLPVGLPNLRVSAPTGATVEYGQPVPTGVTLTIKWFANYPALQRLEVHDQTYSTSFDDVQDVTHTTASGVFDDATVDVWLLPDNIGSYIDDLIRAGGNVAPTFDPNGYQREGATRSVYKDPAWDTIHDAIVNSGTKIASIPFLETQVGTGKTVTVNLPLPDIGVYGVRALRLAVTTSAALTPDTPPMPDPDWALTQSIPFFHSPYNIFRYVVPPGQQAFGGLEIQASDYFPDIKYQVNYTQQYRFTTPAVTSKAQGYLIGTFDRSSFNAHWREPDHTLITTKNTGSSLWVSGRRGVKIYADDHDRLRAMNVDFDTGTGTEFDVGQEYGEPYANLNAMGWSFFATIALPGGQALRALADGNDVKIVDINDKVIDRIRAADLELTRYLQGALYQVPGTSDVGLLAIFENPYGYQFLYYQRYRTGPFGKVGKLVQVSKDIYTPGPWNPYNLSINPEGYFAAAPIMSRSGLGIANVVGDRFRILNLPSANDDYWNMSNADQIGHKGFLVAVQDFAGDVAVGEVDMTKSEGGGFAAFDPTPTIASSLTSGDLTYILYTFIWGSDNKTGQFINWSPYCQLWSAKSLGPLNDLSSKGTDLKDPHFKDNPDARP